MASRPLPRQRRETARDRQREATRQRILDVARRLFTEYGYDDVPVTEIGREAGVSHSMINVYFGSKSGLLYAIVRENNAPQFEGFDRIAGRSGPAWERISDILRTSAEIDMRDIGLMAMMQSYSWVWPEEAEQENAADRQRFTALIAGLILEGIARGEFRAGIDPATAARAVFAIYTMGLRAGVFEDCSPADCHQRVMEETAQILKASP